MTYLRVFVLLHVALFVVHGMHVRDDYFFKSAVVLLATQIFLDLSESRA
jgi:hypothetical protein